VAVALQASAEAPVWRRGTLLVVAPDAEHPMKFRQKQADLLPGSPLAAG